MKKLIYLLFFSVFIQSCTKVYHIAKTENESYEIQNVDTEIDMDTAIQNLITPYKTSLDSEMNAIVGDCPEALIKEQPEGSLGNWMADIIFEKAGEYFGEKIDFSAQNYGSMRIPSLPAGAISKGKIYEFMPFENRMVLLYVKGAVVQQFFNRMAEAGGWPVSAGVRFKIIDGKPVDISINNESLDLEKEYLLAIPDYVANGGDNCDFFRDVKRKESPKLVRDAIFEYIAVHPSITSKIEGRVTIK